MSTKFTEGQKVIKIISIRGSKTATIEVVESVAKEVRLLESCLTFSPLDGRETDPAFPPSSGITCEILPFDDGEIERWGL